MFLAVDFDKSGSIHGSEILIVSPTCGPSSSPPHERAAVALTRRRSGRRGRRHVGRGGAGTRAPSAGQRRSRRDTVRDPTPAGTAADAADSTPIVEPVRPETRDRRDAPIARPSGVHRTGGKIRALCTKRPRGDPVRIRCTESGRSRRPNIHTAESRGTLVRQIAEAPRRPAATRRARGRSRNSPARSRRAWSLWGAVRTRSMAAPRPHHRRPTCQHAGPVKSGVGASIASAWSGF